MKKDFLSIKDLSKKDVNELFSLTERLKRTRPNHERPLQNKTFALIFEKPSLRTRVTFETAIYELGGKSIYLSQRDIGLGKRESIKDVAQNLSQWVSGIIARVFAHQTLTELAKYAAIPVINALSDYEHPCQALADLFTLYEKFKKTPQHVAVPLSAGRKTFDGLKFAYIGDGNNVCRSLMLLANVCGLKIIVATPKGYEPYKNTKRKTNISGVADFSLRNTIILNEPREAVKDADIVYTDVWVSMGQEEERRKRLKIFKDFQLNSNLLRYAKPNCLIMHCLPAHRGEEITSELLDSKNSIVLQQAANRLHTQKALLIKLYKR